MTLTNHALFQVAVKAIVRHEDKILVLMTHNDRVDFPGGRMDQTEVDIPITEVLKREVIEELGSEFKFKLNDFALISKRKYHDNDKEHNILAIYYDVNFITGELQISDEHKEIRWVKPDELLPLEEQFESKDEFEQFKQYFNL